MKKIIKLTENDLSRIVKKVLVEQESDINYQQISDELVNALKGAKSYFVPPKAGEPYGFEIEQVTVPSDAMGKKSISIIGKEGRVVGDDLTPVDKPIKLYIEYFCKTSLDQESNKGAVIDGGANLQLSQQKQGIMDGKGRINKKLANFIETTWCQKLPKGSSSNPFL
jgi:hypothetical protein